jgi:pilus assembly protein CpaB
MAAVIPSGMRAVSIQTNNVSTGVAGFILPGNKVDVLLSVSTQGADDRTGGGSTITLLQNVEILAVDQRIDAPQDNKMDAKELRSVTLLVNPADAAKLDLGQNKGTLHLVLRNATDTGTEDVEPATLAGLKVGSSEPIVVVQKSENIPPAPAKKAPLLIRTLRGSRSGYITFPTPEEAPRDDEAADSQTSTASSTEVEASAGPASSVDPAAPAIH